MIFDILTADQRTPEWYQARVGRLTASRAADMLATIKTGEAAARRDLRLQLVCERLTGQSQDDGYTNAAMERGIELEPRAFAAYEALTGAVAHEVGFLGHRTLLAGCSPDGAVDGFTGILELKCPKSATHLGYLQAGAVPSTYLPQITHALWITGAAWCDFLSFDDRFPEPLQVFLKRVTRADVDIAGYEAKARVFLAEVDTATLAVRTMADLRGTLAQAVVSPGMSESELYAFITGADLRR